jgi:hypothetical protein
MTQSEQLTTRSSLRAETETYRDRESSPHFLSRCRPPVGSSRVIRLVVTTPTVRIGGAEAKPWGWLLRLSGMSGMSRVAVWVAMAVAVGSLAGGCGSGPAGRPAGPAGPAIVRGVAITEPSVSAAPYSAADMAFGLDVLNAWCKQSPQANIVLSPASLASGLGMAYLGSGRSTARYGWRAAPAGRRDGAGSRAAGPRPGAAGT